jgi:hypothetical protein
MKDLERAILAEATEVTGNPKLKDKEVVEWVMGPIELLETHEGETKHYLPKLNISVCIKLAEKKPKAAKKTGGA